MNKRVLIKLSLMFSLATFFIFSYPSDTEAKFIKTFFHRLGGTLTVDEISKIANGDVFLTVDAKYDDINGDTWVTLKNLNPNIKIYLYYQITQCADFQDNLNPPYGNGLARYNVAKGHPQGSLNGDHPKWFLLDSSGTREYNNGFYLMDFGDADFQNYAAVAVSIDFYNRPWMVKADGMYFDVLFPILSYDYGTTQKYPTDEAWAVAMNSMIDYIVNYLHSNFGWKVTANRTVRTTTDEYVNAMLAADQLDHPLDGFLIEYAFVSSFGTADANFWSETDWKKIINLIGNIQNSEIYVQSFTKITDSSGSGVDNYGKTFTFWDAYWYGMTSFLLAKKDNTYWNYQGHPYDYSITYQWQDELDSQYLDLGGPVGNYQVTVVGGRNIYWREYEKGYVYVNPTPYDVDNITLPQQCKQLNHYNFKNDPLTIPDVTSINLKSHRGTILLKTNITKDNKRPLPPVLIGVF